MGEAAPNAVPGAPTLEDFERQLLMFERQWWCYEGSKDAAIRNLFGIDPTHYYKALSALIDTDQALAFDPSLVKRLRRNRDERQRARAVRRLQPPRQAGPNR